MYTINFELHHVLSNIAELGLVMMQNNSQLVS
jgi:hypothetical protein